MSCSAQAVTGLKKQQRPPMPSRTGESACPYLWTFLDEARDPGLIKPGALVVAGDEDTAPSARSSTLRPRVTARSCT
jgi:hypothetical protein